MEWLVLHDDGMACPSCGVNIPLIHHLVLFVTVAIVLSALRVPAREKRESIIFPGVVEHRARIQNMCCLNTLLYIYVLTPPPPPTVFIFCEKILYLLH